MKIIIRSIIFLIVSSCSSKLKTSNEKFMFHKKQNNCEIKVLEIENSGKYKIVLIGNDADYNKNNYPMINFTNSAIDTIQVIYELLSLEGDKRTCYIPLKNYNNLSSQIISGNYTIEIEALFLINQFYLGEDFINYSPFAIIESKCNLDNSVIIELAFKNYNEWFNKIKKNGINNTRRKDIMPLKDDCVFWRN